MYVVVESNELREFIRTYESHPVILHSKAWDKRRRSYGENDVEYKGKLCMSCVYSCGLWRLMVTVKLHRDDCKDIKDLTGTGKEYLVIPVAGAFIELVDSDETLGDLIHPHIMDELKGGYKYGSL